MKNYRNFILSVVLLSGLLTIVRSGIAEAQAEKNIRGHIDLNFPNAPEAKIEINLSGKLIGLVARAAKHDRETVELLEMLEGVYVRGYHQDDADFGEVNRYYENKLIKEGWDVIAKVKEDDGIVEVRILSDQDMVKGLFIMVAGNEDILLVNIFGRINPERIGELLDSLIADDLGDFDIGLDNLNMGFELNMLESDEDYKPRLQKRQSGKWEFSEQLDWILNGASISVISAKTTHGAITLEGSVQDNVIIHVFKQVSTRDKADAEEFAKKVHIYVEQHGKEIKIYRKHPKPPRGINVSVSYEIQCPSTVDVNLHTTHSKIEINGVEGAVDAVTTHGRIKLHGGVGRIHAVTTHGKIEASVRRLTDEGKFVTTHGPINVAIGAGVAPVLARTTHGSINLKLPEDFSGYLDAKTSNGQVRSDFLVPFTDKSKKQLTGKIGKGGLAKVTLRTTNGNINLKK